MNFDQIAEELWKFLGDDPAEIKKELIHHLTITVLDHDFIIRECLVCARAGILLPWEHYYIPSNVYFTYYNMQDDEKILKV